MSQPLPLGKALAASVSDQMPPPGHGLSGRGLLRWAVPYGVGHRTFWGYRSSRKAAVPVRCHMNQNADRRWLQRKESVNGRGLLVEDPNPKQVSSTNAAMPMSVHPAVEGGQSRILPQGRERLFLFFRAALWLHPMLVSTDP